MVYYFIVSDKISRDPFRRLLSFQRVSVGLITLSDRMLLSSLPMDWVCGTVLGRPPRPEEDLLLAMPPAAAAAAASSGCSWEEERTSVLWGLGPMLREACISLFPTTWTPRSSSIVDSFCAVSSEGGGGREVVGK